MNDAQDVKVAVRLPSPTATASRPASNRSPWSAPASNVADSPIQSWEKYRTCRLRQFVCGR
jgi:hypothetical protein